MEQQLPTTYVKDNKLMARIDFLKPWNDNPRYITEDNFEKLKRTLQNKQFKPLLILDDGTVLGGNMRLRAYKDLGVKELWVTIITIRQDGELISSYINGQFDQRFQSREDALLHYSTIDNSEYGNYDKQKVAELFSYSELPLDEYLVSTQDLMNMEDILSEFSPPEENKENEEKKTKEIECPNCGYLIKK